MVTYPTELPSPANFRDGHRFKIRDRNGRVLEFELIELDGHRGWGAPRTTSPSGVAGAAGAAGPRRLERRSMPARTRNGGISTADARRLLGLPPKGKK